METAARAERVAAIVLGIIFEIDYDTVAAWARLNDVTYTGFTSLTQNPDVIRMIGEEIIKSNKDLARTEQVKVFRVIPKELDPEQEGEPVTPTRKVKRHLMYEKFQDLVESMYSTTEERRVASEVGDLLNQTGSQ